MFGPSLILLLLCSQILLARIVLANQRKQSHDCSSQWNNLSGKNQLVTFVVLTNGQPGLADTLLSLSQQLDPRWLAIVYIDGMVTDTQYIDSVTGIPSFFPFIDTIDDRICFFHTFNNTFKSECDANKRNNVVSLVRTPWVTFLKDSETRSSYFVESIAVEATRNSSIDCVLFRSSDSIGSMINEFYGSPYEVRYIVNTRVFRNVKFDNSLAADYLFIRQLQLLNYSIMLSKRSFAGSENYGIGLRGSVESKDRGVVLWNEKSNAVTWREAKSNKIAGDRYKALELISGCSTKASSEPHFIFYEESNMFFGTNIRGLKASLRDALHRGCLGDWSHGNIDIPIIFTATRDPRSRVYIQVQLEQLETRHFSRQYYKKLINAAQVWEFFPKNPKVKTVPNDASYFVPTITLLDRQPVYDCNTIPSSISHVSRASFRIYFGGYYRVCEVGSDVGIVNGPLSPSQGCNNCSNPSPSFIQRTDCSVLLNNSHNLDVLQFGALEQSFGNRRELLCDEYHKNSELNVLCIHGIFGQALNYLVCSAKIIVVERYYKNSMLETHRIDPLLQIGKIVVSPPSSNEQLDLLYTPVVFTKRKELVSTSRHILKDFSSYNQSHFYGIKSFISSRLNNQDPLCYALRRLNDDLNIQNKQITGGPPSVTMYLRVTSPHHLMFLAFVSLSSVLVICFFIFRLFSVKR